MAIIEVLSIYPWLFYAVVGVLGLLIGSFLNVVIFRLPVSMEYEWDKESSEQLDIAFDETRPKPPGLAVSRSHCPKCKNKLSALHNIPVLSYLFLKGKCAFCKTSISLRYPFIELFTSILSLVVAYKFGATFQTLAALLLTWFLIVIAFIDLDTMFIPDPLSYSLMWLGLFFSLFLVFVSPREAIIGALVGYLSLWLIYHLFKLLTGKEGLGYGDFKLLAAAGAWLGPEMLILVLMFSSFSGVLIGGFQMLFANKSHKIAFGPYLAAGIWLCLIFWQYVADWYLPGL